MEDVLDMVSKCIEAAVFRAQMDFHDFRTRAPVVEIEPDPIDPTRRLLVTLGRLKESRVENRVKPEERVREFVEAQLRLHVAQRAGVQLEPGTSIDGVRVSVDTHDPTRITVSFQRGSDAHRALFPDWVGYEVTDAELAMTLQCCRPSTDPDFPHQLRTGIGKVLRRRKLAVEDAADPVRHGLVLLALTKWSRAKMGTTQYPRPDEAEVLAATEYFERIEMDRYAETK